jgi:hypothetical protein
MPTAKQKGHYDRLFTPNDKSRETGLWRPNRLAPDLSAKRKRPSLRYISVHATNGYPVSKREILPAHRAFSPSRASCRNYNLGVQGRTLRMTKKLFLLFVLLLAATAAVAATSDSGSSNATVNPAIRTYLMPDLSFKSVFTPELLGQPAAVASQPDGLAAAAPAKLGFCQCGCGIRCSTSADCGGAACRPFITCCDRKAQSADAEWFRSSQASHKTAVPEAILKADCN